MDNPKRVAVELLTLWMEHDTKRIDAVLNDPEEADPRGDAINGLLNLSMLMLRLLAKERGGTDEDMDQMAAAVLVDLSIQLPE